MKIWQSAAVDLDGDGEEEAVLSVYGVSGEWDTFVVDRQPADEEAFTLAQETQAGKADAAWEDL